MICRICPTEFEYDVMKPTRIYCSNLCNKRAWAIRNSPSKNCSYLGNPDKGIRWEEWFINKFGAERPSRSHGTPFDFWWNDERIDLKVCELNFRKFRRGKPCVDTIGHWTFNTNSKVDIDAYICIGLENDRPVRFFKIPFDDFPKGGVSISRVTSKYNKYIFEPK